MVEVYRALGDLRYRVCRSQTVQYAILVANTGLRLNLAPAYSLVVDGVEVARRAKPLGESDAEPDTAPVSDGTPSQ